MNALENLYSRRSIRSYTGEAITEAELQEILKAAYAAPVGRAQYGTLHLTVITNQNYLNRWEDHMGNVTGNPGMHPFYGAPTVILVSSNVAPAPACNINYSNAAIVAHNMALAAAELGVGACHIWGAVMTMGGNAELIKELNLPDGMAPCCAIALGKTNETYAVREIPANRITTDYLG